jgi:hypothetical protein
VLYNVFEILTFFKDLIFSWFLYIFYTLAFVFLKFIHFFSNLIAAEVIPTAQYKTNSVNIPFKSNVNYNAMTRSVTLKTKNDLLLSSLYLQKVIKYLHLTNMSDFNVLNNNINNNFLDLYYIFHNRFVDLNYILFFMNNNKFNNTPINTHPFSNKEKLFYKCINKQQLVKVNYYVLNSNILKSLPFLFQNEFKNSIKQNLNLGKENK